MKELIQFLQIKKEIIEEGLMAYTFNENLILQRLHESMRYSLFPGGKRIRPLFCYLSGDLFDVDDKKLLSLACAVEMIHVASLVLDDLPLMDNSNERRGRASNHIVYGEDVACLAAIGLIMKTYEIIACDLYLDDKEKTAVISKLSKASGAAGMVGGQYADLTCIPEQMDVKMMEFIHMHKTSSLFMVAGSIAAIVSNASEKEIKAIEDYALNIGYAFQIQDDILDCGNDDKPGANCDDDRINFVQMFGLSRAREMVMESTRKAIESIAIFGEKNSKMIKLADLLMRRDA